MSAFIYSVQVSSIVLFSFIGINVSWRQQSYTFFENESAEVEMNSSILFQYVKSIPTISRQINPVFSANHPSLSNYKSVGIGRSTVEFSGVEYEVAFAGITVTFGIYSFNCHSLYI